ncbi:hypothetical protein IDJ77_11195 [Mucilaginibacter sp. ZT4R22]|uniref:Uncharacterized protein n=1 Tax=Mucilaginibacter pankratovii TaxID=2772110 RepID=A0ABR7WPX0_9SPHI|nr:hypothetical protein [Mucilaginibacter pankratovii]MBD1364374.1 hypothetical protein [Mucilaginibacter pankratovii]
MPLPTDDSEIAVGTPGPEFPVPPTAPATTPQGVLSIVRKRAIGNGTCRLDPADNITLPTITQGAQSAILVLEAAPGADKSTALGRFWSDGTWPGTVTGMPMYHGSVIEIVGMEDLNNTRIITTDGLTHKINVQYFSQA